MNKEEDKVMLVKIKIELKNMPFDKYVDGEGFVHSTGYEVIFEDGSSAIEYEDYIYDEAEDCIYVNEEDYYIEEEEEE